MNIGKTWIRQISDRRRVRGHWPVIVRGGNVLILPTRFGLLAAASLLVLLLIAINYQNSSVFLLCFLLAATGWTVMIAAHRQLTRLSLRRISIPLAEEGSEPTIQIRLEDIAGRQRYGLMLSIQSAISEISTILPRSDQNICLALPRLSRGHYQFEEITLHNEYPFGLFHAWTRISQHAELFVYPKAVPVAPEPITLEQNNPTKSAASGQEDFFEFRRYRAGDRPAQIAWSVYARTGHLEKKHFSSNCSLPDWLDFDSVPNADEELRLAILTRWVIDFHEQKRSFGLRLPGYEVEQGHGPAHLEVCLKALACYPGPYKPPFMM